MKQFLIGVILGGITYGQKKELLSLTLKSGKYLIKNVALFIGR